MMMMTDKQITTAPTPLLLRAHVLVKKHSENINLCGRPHLQKKNMGQTIEEDEGVRHTLFDQHCPRSNHTPSPTAGGDC